MLSLVEIDPSGSGIKDSYYHLCIIAFWLLHVHVYPTGEELVLHLNKSESPSPKNALS